MISPHPSAPHGPAGISVCYRLAPACAEAAVLTLPDGASSEDYQSLTELRTHAIRNAGAWYEFINGRLGFGARNGSVYFVSGCDKATTWGIAAVSNAAASASASTSAASAVSATSAAATISATSAAAATTAVSAATSPSPSSSSSRALRFTAAQRANPRDPYSYSWDTDCPASASVRTGPDAASASGPHDARLPQNQCLFVRGFKIMLRERPARMASWGGPAYPERDMKRKSDGAHSGRADAHFFPGSKSLRAGNATAGASGHRRGDSGVSDSSMSSGISDDSYLSEDSDADVGADAGVSGHRVLASMWYD